MKSTRQSRALSLSILFALTVLAPGLALANPGVGCDLNGDGVVNLADIGQFAVLFFAPGYQASIDFNCDGIVNLADLGLLASCF